MSNSSINGNNNNGNNNNGDNNNNNNNNNNDINSTDRKSRCSDRADEKGRCSPLSSRSPGRGLNNTITPLLSNESFISNDEKNVTWNQPSRSARCSFLEDHRDNDIDQVNMELAGGKTPNRSPRNIIPDSNIINNNPNNDVNNMNNKNVPIGSENKTETGAGTGTERRGSFKQIESHERRASFKETITILEESDTDNNSNTKTKTNTGINAIRSSLQIAVNEISLIADDAHPANMCSPQSNLSGYRGGTC